MARDARPVGEIVLVGRSGYQIYSEIWNDKLRFTARIGIPFKKKDSGERRIVAIMEADSTDDFLRAAEAAKAQLEQIRQASFQTAVEQKKQTVEEASLKLVGEKPGTDSERNAA